MQHPAFGGLMNDSTAQMGFQVGKSAVIAGQEYMEQNVSLRLRRSTLRKTFKIHTHSMPVQSLRKCIGLETLLQREQ